MLSLIPAKSILKIIFIHLQLEMSGEPMLTLIERIFENVTKSGDRIILSDSDGEYTNRELWDVSARTYSYLAGLGIGREDIVLVHLPRNARTIMVLMGIFKAGAAAVVLETDGKKEWEDNVFSNISPRLTIDRTVMETIMNCTPLDGFRKAGLHDLAYIAFTTGSTGRQKGVMHEYGTLEKFLESSDLLMEIFPKMPDYRIAQTSSIHTSLMTFAFYIACNTFIDIVPYSDMRDNAAFTRRLTEKKITYTFLSPLYLHKYGIPDTPYLKYISLSYEPLCLLYSDKVELYNEYGARETGTCVCEFKVDRLYDITPIGKPLPCFSIAVMDAFDRQVKDGELGEICIPNEYCRGYLNRPEETAQQFKNGYFHTRDIGMKMPDGNYISYGRMTDAVTTKDGLITALEIEVAARKILGSANVYVKVFPTASNPLICLYTDFPIDFQMLRQSLEATLPAYKIPTKHIQLKEFEYSNGKAIKVHLPNPSNQ